MTHLCLAATKCACCRRLAACDAYYTGTRQWNWVSVCRRAYVFIGVSTVRQTIDVDHASRACVVACDAHAVNCTDELIHVCRSMTYTTWTVLLVATLVLVCAVDAGPSPGLRATPTPESLALSAVESAPCSGHGVLVNNTTTHTMVCNCFPGYTTSDCSYTQKSQVIAILCAVFASSVGAEMYYLGYYGAGGAMTAAFVVLVCGSACASCYLRLAADERELNRCMVGATICVQCLFCVYWWSCFIAMVVIAADCKMNDANGYPMYCNA